MTLQSSGAISLTDIRDEYNNGSSAPIELDDYYRGGSFVRANATNNTSTNLSADVPTSANSSPLSINDFYGQKRAFRKTYASTATDQSGVGVFGDDFAVDYPKEIVINSSQTVGATSTSEPALKIDSTGVGTITITNNGSIEGAGGAAGAAGGNALQVDGSVAVTLVNNGTIKAGGGGGGNGGAGGNGVASATAVLSNFVDEGGTPYGTNNVPSNDAPSWFTQYNTSHDLNGQGVVSDRKWGGLNGNAPQPGAVNVSWGLFSNASAFRGSLANRGPFYCSFQVSIAASYSLSATLTTTYGTGYGSPRINISTSNTSASQGQGGGEYGNGASLNLAANTTYYLVGFLNNIFGGTNLYYNNFDFLINLAVNNVFSGGSGGAGGVGQGYNQSAGSGSSGSAGSNNSGSGGAGGAGGAFGAAGSSGSTGGNGSGTSISYPSTAPTNGSSGGSGGASGKSIQGVSNVTESGSGTKTGGTA
tara:strand:- start:2763 stop:4187 length:1425 start_codon:yes stop_codon:yes gene_type:complete